MKKIVITQSNYIPWKGYFDSIAISDEFVIYDDMQYTKRDWRNRNIIKTNNGLKWLTIPVEVKGKFFQKIKDTKISDKNWNINHLSTLKHNYKNSNKFNEVKDFIEDLYFNATQNYLTEINVHFLTELSKYLKIKQNFKFSSEFNLSEDRNQRLVDICLKLNGNQYFSGPAARNYMNESLFEKSGIEVIYFDYSGYKEYEQLYPPFEHGVSILDLIFNMGEDAYKYLKSTRK
jgi:hypothetical protein